MYTLGSYLRFCLSPARLLFVLSAALCVDLIVDQPAAVAQSSADAPQNAAPANRRVLRFPTDRAMGVIYWRKAPTDEKDRLWMFGDEWRRVAEGRGNVRLPADGEARLNISKAGSTDLSGLDALEPDALQAMSCRWTDVNDEALVHIGRLTGLRMLDLQSTPTADAGIAHLGNLKKLQWLSLEAFATNKKGFGAGDEAMKTIAKLPELELLFLRDTKVTDDGLSDIAKIKSLTTLDLSGTKVSDAGLKWLKQLPKLNYLRLGVYREGAVITDDGLVTIGELANLEHLDLSGTKVTNQGLSHLHTLKHLKELTLEHTKVTEAGLANLAPLESLEDLRLYLGTPVTDVGAEHLAKVKSLRTITDNLEVTDKGVALLATLPNLERIEFYGPGVTDEGAKQIGQVKSLKWLEFQKCPITDVALASFSDLPNLELFRLYETQVSGQGFRYMRGSPKLSLLGVDFGGGANFRRRQQVPPDFHPTLAEIGKLNTLERLEIRGQGLGADDVEAISHMRQLKELQIESGLSIDDDGIKLIASLSGLTGLTIGQGTISNEGLKGVAKLRDLRHLSLVGNFNDEGLAPLAELKSLWSLSLTSPNVTSEAIDRLQKQLPALQIGK